MRLEEALVTILQGMSDHALAKDKALYRSAAVFEGAVVRFRIHNPYFNFYIVFQDESIQLKGLHEGDITACIDADAYGLLKTLYTPSFCLEHELEDILLIPGKPELSQFLVKLIQYWDLWNLFQLICSEFLPWVDPHQVTLEDLRFMKKGLDRQFDSLASEQQKIVEAQSESRALIVQMQRQLRFQTALIGLLVLSVVTMVSLFVLVF